MRQFNWALLAITVSLASARQSTWSIHDDLVAYPQYEIVFSESFISLHDAKALLDSVDSHPTYSADFSSQSGLTHHVRGASPDHDASNDGSSPDLNDQETYEMMRLGSSSYLCSIPVLEPPTAQNETATQLAKREEARELSRASAAGWDLLSPLNGKCLYFMSGWWSYSFCYNREIVQFHALPMIPNGKPPIRDPSTLEFVLGRAPKSAANQQQQQEQGQGQGQEQQGSADDQSPTTDVQMKGDQRYLVQRFGDGTTCDLTGRERTIEIQYHCVPGTTVDRISWIREVTTCAYLMVVNTPRLCSDVAFLPPKQTTSNPISCRVVLDTDDPHAETAWHQHKTLEAEAAMRPPVVEDRIQPPPEDPDGLTDVETDPFYQEARVTVGGVVVGGRNVLGPLTEDSPILRPPQGSFPYKPAAQNPIPEEEPVEAEVIAMRKSKAKGGEYWSLTDKQLEEELELDLDAVKKMREEVDQLAGDAGWTLEIVNTSDDMRELRAYVDHDDEDEAPKTEGQGQEDGGEGSEEQFYD